METLKSLESLLEKHPEWAGLPLAVEISRRTWQMPRGSRAARAMETLKSLLEKHPEWADLPLVGMQSDGTVTEELLFFVSEGQREPGSGRAAPVQLVVDAT